MDHMDLDFIDQVEERSRSNLSRCWHCLTCSGGCPFSEEMDYPPNALSLGMIKFMNYSSMDDCSYIKKDISQ